MPHVSTLTRRTGSAQGCIGCGKVWSDSEIDNCTCTKCLGRVRTLVETEYWTDSYGDYVPGSVIDFSKLEGKQK